MNKKITDELVEKLLAEKGFGMIDSRSEEHMMNVVCDYYHRELTDQWHDSCDFFIYEENTADGYSVYVACHDPNKISINEDVYYYESDLQEVLVDHFLDRHNSDARVYVCDLDADHVIEAVKELYTEAYDKTEQSIIENLKDQGYK
jgi:hypothetical protein